MQIKANIESFLSACTKNHIKEVLSLFLSLSLSLSLSLIVVTVQVFDAEDLLNGRNVQSIVSTLMAINKAFQVTL